MDKCIVNGMEEGMEKAENEKRILDSDSIKRRLLDKYPFGYIPRIEIKKATGNIVGPSTLANLKDGILGAKKIGGRICYPVENVIKFVQNRMNEAG